MMMGWYGPYGWIGMLISTVIGLIVLGGFIWLVVWAVRRSSREGWGGYNTPAGPSPKEIAAQRFARGEITREQYLQLIEDLSH